MKKDESGGDDRLLFQMLWNMCDSPPGLMRNSPDDCHPRVEIDRISDRRWVDLNSELNPLWKYCAEHGSSGDLAFRTAHKVEGSPNTPIKRRPSYVSCSASLVGSRVLCIAFLLVVGALNAMDWSGDGPSVTQYAGDVTSRYRAIGSNVSPLTSVGMQRVLAARRRGWASRRSRLGVLDSAIYELRLGFHSTHDQFQRAEAAFFLGNAYGMAGDLDASRAWLRLAVEQGVEDYRAESLEMIHNLDTD